MINYIKENLTEEDLSIILDEYECNFSSENGKYHSELADKCKVLDLKFECVESYGGEGKGDEYWYVFKVTHNGESKLFKLDGWYASYHGHTFESYKDFYEVHPKEKTIIVYER